VYDDRAEYVCKRGTNTYKFDPICPVDDEQHARWFLALRPVTFEVTTEHGCCPYCNFVGKIGKSGSPYYSLRTHINTKHKDKVKEFKENFNDPSRDAESDTSGNKGQD